MVAAIRLRGGIERGVAFLAVAVVAAVMGASPLRPAHADSHAGEFLVALSDRAVTELTEPGITAEEQERRFRALIAEGFDIPTIGRFVLGRYWRRASAAERTAFLRVFEDLIVNRFLPLFGQYSGEKIAVQHERPFANNADFVNVSTLLVGQDGDEPLQIDWRVHRVDGRLKIVDIVAEGISIAVTLRSEYNSVLKQNGGDVSALVNTLRAKIADLRG